LITPGQRSELTRQGEGDHKVLDRQQLGALSVEPQAGFMVLALGATAVTAGMRKGLRFGAIGAL
jgi:hypothetical protein